MKKVLNFVKLRGVSIKDQLRYEEVLLRRSDQNWYCGSQEFIFNARSQHVAIVLGFSGKIHELVNIDAVSRDKVSLIRRYTGGGTVVVDEDTVFTSFVMNDADVPSKPFPRDIMAWSESDVFGPVFTAKKDDGESSKFSLRENDYVLDARKIGGNAQSIVRGRWVHHTSFLWDFNAERMKYLQMPKKRPEYRADRDHLDFLSTIKNHLPSIEDFEDRIEKQLSEKFEVSMCSEETMLEIVSTLTSTTPEKDLKLLIRTRIESVEEHLILFNKAMAMSEIEVAAIN